MKNKKYMTISTIEKKHLQNSTSIPNKTLNKVGIEETYLNIIKVIYKKSTASIVPNSERQKVFPLKSRTKQRYPVSGLLINIVLGVLT